MYPVCTQPVYVKEGNAVSRGQGAEGRVRVVVVGGGTLSEGGDALEVGRPNGGWAVSNHGHVGEDSDGVVGGAQGRGRRPTGGASGTPRWRAAVAREVTKRRVERRVEPPPLPVEAAVETVSEDLVEDALMSHLIGPPRPGSRGLAPARSLPLEPLSCLRCAGVLRSAYWR